MFTEEETEVYRIDVDKSITQLTSGRAVMNRTNLKISTWD
jgi:hypothetical protein